MPMEYSESVYSTNAVALTLIGRIDTFRVLDKDGFFLISPFGLVSQTVAAERDAPQEFMVR